MGADHAKIFSEDVPGAELKVVCDADVGTARRVADAYGASDASIDAHGTIDRVDVDAIVIASPDETHSELTLKAIEKGKAVLCEKPLSPSIDECLTVLEAENKIGKQLIQIGFMRRFDPAYVNMKAELSSGRVGDAIMMHNFHRNVTAPAGFNGMMAISNSAPHEFDAIRFVLDAEIVAISAFEPALDNQGACKPVVLVLETSKGQLVTVEVNNNASYGYDVKGELVGTDGSISLAWQPPTRTDKGLISGLGYPEDWRPRFYEAYVLQDKAWINAIQTGTPAIHASNAWDGYCASAIAQCGVNALKSGLKTQIELISPPELYSKFGEAA